MTELSAAGTLAIVALSGQDILTPYSGRGITETLTPIEQNVAPRRNVNGALRNIAFDAFRKYSVELTCKDFSIPALDGVWRGQQLLISCLSELSYRVGGTPGRSVVSGSSRTEGDFVYYRPQLLVMVTDLTVSKDEWPADVAWTLKGDEV